jgi:hypothetical protein
MNAMHSELSKPRLSFVRSRGDWSPLLSLIGWREIAIGTWTDEASALSDSLNANFAFSNCAETHSARTPAGLRVDFDRRGCVPLESREFVMNHVSINVRNVDSERGWFEGCLGSDAVILARASAFDPIKQDYQADAHLFNRPNFYITIRGTSDNPSVDHCGWMTASSAGVDRAATILHKLKWPIVLGPTTLDGSYLVHFEGPDGHIHDFFHPAPELDRLGQ